MKFHSYQRAGVAALLTHPALFPQPAVEGLYVVRQTGPLGGRVTREVRATPETIVDVAFRGASVDTKVEWKLAGTGEPAYRTSNPRRRFYSEAQAVSYNRGYVDRCVTSTGLLDFSALGFHDAEKEEDARAEEHRERNAHR